MGLQLANLASRVATTEECNALIAPVKFSGPVQAWLSPLIRCGAANPVLTPILSQGIATFSGLVDCVSAAEPRSRQS